MGRTDGNQTFGGSVPLRSSGVLYSAFARVHSKKNVEKAVRSYESLVGSLWGWQIKIVQLNNYKIELTSPKWRLARGPEVAFIIDKEEVSSGKDLVFKSNQL